MADEAVRVARLELGEAAAVTATGTWSVPRKAFVQGLARDRDLAALLVRDIAAWAGPVDAVRVGLATPEQVVTRSSAIDHDLLRLLAGGWAPRSGSGRELVAAAARIRGRSDGSLVGALDRRDVMRTVTTFRPLAARVAVEPLPVALLRIVPSDLVRERHAATLHLREGRLAWVIDLESLTFSVRRAAGFGAGTDLSLSWDLQSDGPSVPWLEGIDVIPDLRRPTTLNQMGVAIGAALGAGDSLVGSLDLALSDRVVALEPVDELDSGVTWLVERLGDPDVPALTQPTLVGGAR
jgi:hypothetical protein